MLNLIQCDSGGQCKWGVTRRVIASDVLRVRSANRAAFTLFELLIVVTILAMVAAVTGVGFRATLVRTREKLAIDTWLLADHQARTLAYRTQQEIEIRSDRRTGAIMRESSTDGTPTSLGHVDKKLQLKTLNSDATAFSRCDSIFFTASGQSDNYLICSGRVVLVVGATGQVVDVKNEVEAKAILSEDYGNS